MEKMPRQLADWINQRASDLAQGMEVRETIYGFDLIYMLSWDEGIEATISFISITHPMMGNYCWKYSDYLIDEIAKTHLFLLFNKRIADLSALIEVAEATYDWKFEG